MHNLPKKFYFIKNFNIKELKNLNPNTAIIYRNYEKKHDFTELLQIKRYCKKKSIKIFLSNNFKLAYELKYDGVYLPSFNKSIKHLSYNLRKNFLIIGSAHNLKEIRLKEAQAVSLIFISSIFKKNNNYLGLYRFINLIGLTKKNVIALGGISKKNIKIINFTRSIGYAGISYFKKP